MRFMNCLNDPMIELPKANAYAPSTAGDDFGNKQRIVAQFYQCLREARHNRPDVCVLLAIQRTADVTMNSDAYVAKTLVERGLRAPRMAFPGEYLDHIVTALARHPHHMGSASETDRDLYAHWLSIGDDPFAGFEVIPEQTIHMPESEMIH